MIRVFAETLVVTLLFEFFCPCLRFMRLLQNGMCFNSESSKLFEFIVKLLEARLSYLTLYLTISCIFFAVH